MGHIAFEVDSALAKAWNNSSPSVKAMYENKVMAILNELKKPKAANEHGITKEQLDFLKAEAAENMEPYEWWNDEELIVVLDKEAADLESGKIKGFILEESMARLRNKSRRNE